VLNNIKIFEFIEQLVEHIKSKNTFDAILQDVKQTKKTWDQVARKRVGSVVKDMFRKLFPEIEIKEALYIEGEGPPVLWKKPYDLFGSGGVYPDIGILRPERIAIELDHSEIGRPEIPGSRLKVALAKASFNYLSGDWNYCFVLFHNISGKPIKPYLNRETEQKILRFYEERLHTKLYIFE